MISLRPMTQADYEAYLDIAVDDYAQEHVRAGNWKPGEAQALARAQYEHYLPGGVRTPGHGLFLFIAPGESEPVGMGWLAIQERNGHKDAFIYDIRIYPPFRRNGYGRQALVALEDEARSLGAQRIGLHVFAHNYAALALYEQAGYATTDHWMAKPL
jgi:RimJ/RimL family protein N-acetyltransferase